MWYFFFFFWMTLHNKNKILALAQCHLLWREVHCRQTYVYLHINRIDIRNLIIIKDNIHIQDLHSPWLSIGQNTTLVQFLQHNKNHSSSSIFGYLQEWSNKNFTYTVANCFLKEGLPSTSTSLHTKKQPQRKYLKVMIKKTKNNSSLCGTVSSGLWCQSTKFVKGNQCIIIIIINNNNTISY